METKRRPVAIDAHRDQLLLVTRLRCLVAHPLRRLRGGGPQHNDDPRCREFSVDLGGEVRTAVNVTIPPY